MDLLKAIANLPLFVDCNKNRERFMNAACTVIVISRHDIRHKLLLNIPEHSYTCLRIYLSRAGLGLQPFVSMSINTMVAVFACSLFLRNEITLSLCVKNKSK